MYGGTTELGQTVCVCIGRGGGEEVQQEGSDQC